MPSDQLRHQDRRSGGSRRPAGLEGPQRRGESRSEAEDDGILRCPVQASNQRDTSLPLRKGGTLERVGCAVASNRIAITAQRHFTPPPLPPLAKGGRPRAPVQLNPA